MNTHSLLMTTEQLIEACAQQGVAVSVTQLARWIHEGLIPSSLRTRHGRGRGMGVEWLWQPECLPRIIIIGQTLHHGGTFFQAAKALAVAGYAPTAERLREILLDCLETYKHFIAKRQGYLTKDISLTEKKKRLTRKVRGKMNTLPDALAQPLTQLANALLGLFPGDEKAPDIVMIIQQFLSLPALQQQLETQNDVTLIAHYEEVGRTLPLLLPLLVMAANALFIPLLTHVLSTTKETQEPFALLNAEEILATIRLDGSRAIVSPDNPIGVIRLYITILFTALPTDESSQPLFTFMRHMIDQYAHYFAVPSEVKETPLSEDNRKEGEINGHKQ